MIHTRSCLGVLIFGLCAAVACDQVDPNDSLSSDDSSDTTDDTNDTTDETSKPTSSGTSSSPGTSDTVDSGAADASADTTEGEEEDAGATDESDSTDDSTSSDTTDTTDTGSSNDELCPMKAGATWTYKHTNWTEVQTVTAMEYEGEPAFLVKDTPDPSDNLRADSVLVKRDGRLLRVYKEEFWVNPNTSAETLDAKATYGVGFLRCDEAWATKKPGWSETPEYIRVETVGTDPAKAPEERSHTYTVEGREDITTAKGQTFGDCLRVRRSKDWAAVDSAEDAKEKLYWFCPGVGKVREQNVENGKIEELVEYEIPN